MDQSQKNDGSQSKCVLELYESCEKGSYTKIKKSLEDGAFSKKTLDNAMRRCIKNRKRERNEYHDSLNLLLQHIDINYQNPNEENSTIIMYACKLTDVLLVDLILGFDFSLNQTYQNMKINLQVRDENGRNYLHYLVNKDAQEEEACDVFDRFVNGCIRGSIERGEDIPECIEDDTVTSASKNNIVNSASNALSAYNLNISEDVNVEDNMGYTPLALALISGWSQLSKKFLLVKARSDVIIKASGNNLVHLAVLGQNLNCIKLILSYASIDEVKHKNKDGMTPKEIANHLSLHYYSKIIENYEENCLNPSFLSIFQNNHSLTVSDILQKYYLEDYNESLFLLNQLRINQSILSTSITQETKNYSLEWNVFLTKYHIKIQKNASRIATPAVKSKFEISPESILSKFIENKEKSSQPKKRNILYDFKEFFESIENNTNQKGLQNSTDEEVVKSLDIIIYNRGIYYYKLGDFIKTIRIFADYLKNNLGQNDSMYYKWFLYVNISFILIEGLINHKYLKLVSCIIEKLEEFLFTHIRTKKDDIFTSDLIQVRDYLNIKEVINQFTPTWDESFCLTNLYKAMKNIDESRMEDAKVNMKDFKKLYKNCTYKEEVKVMKTLHNFYTLLKIKMFFYENSFPKCFKNLNKIYNLTKTQQINININDHKIDGRFNDNEYIIFYLNTMGIINLKQKKFLTAEFFFKAGIDHFKKIYLQIESNVFDFTIRLSYIYQLKYNLALCFFFQKQYDSAHIIFREVSKNRTMSGNIFLWYRLGLCCLEIEMTDMRNNKMQNCRNDLVSKVVGYDNTLELPSMHINSLNADIGGNSNNNEYEDFNNDGAVDLDFMDDEDMPAPYNAKRIILQNKYAATNPNKRRLTEAITYFKYVIMLSKPNINTNSKFNERNELNEIYNFYFDKRSAYLDSDYNDDPFEKFSPKVKSLSQIISSTYLNLLFCLSLTENWTEVLFFCSQYEKSDYFRAEKEVMYKFDNFKIEALIHLRQIDRALEVLKANAVLITTNDLKGTFYSRDNSGVYSNTSYRITLNVNLAKLHFINNNILEADKCINNILSMFSGEMQAIPVYVQNLLIYSHLIKGQVGIALNYVKYRKAALNYSGIKK